jgi:pyrroline-5-carboxylate reductase
LPHTRDLPSSLVLVGAGRMGGALLEGWLSVGLDPARIAVFDPTPSPELKEDTLAGVRLNPIAAEVRGPEVLVLAIKPQMLESAAPLFADLAAPGTLLVSILAGRTIADLARAVPGAGAIVRAMPNLPASVGQGATALAADSRASEAQKRAAAALLGAVGLVEWLEGEDLIDAVTALSGSGPAYVFHLTECLAQAGEAAGLPRDLAERLARATVSGAGELMARSSLDPARLRENVTSPAGTTAAALDVLMRPDGLCSLMQEAVLAAKRRAEALSG